MCSTKGLCAGAGYCAKPAALTSVTQGSGGVPFLIHGTTAHPKFEPDLTGLFKGIATAPGHDAGAILNGVLGRKKKS